jgi:hypothetical protein
MSKRKVRILFVNCPTLDVEACTYLLLAQNSFQDLFEFEVCHHWIPLYREEGVRGKLLARFWADTRIFGFKLWGAKKAESAVLAAMECEKYPFLKGEIDIGDMEPLHSLIVAHEEWLQKNPPDYGGAQNSLPTVVITETPLHGQYISNTVGSIAVVTLANWKRQFSPPSALEFILLSVQRLSARVSLQRKLSSHYPTRSCIWDFTANVADIKSAILIGYICSDCRTSLLECLSEDELNKFESLVRHSWIGKLEDPGSVASNLKRVFDYDLSTTRGLKLGLIDRCLDMLWSAETTKFIFAFLGAALVWYLAKHNIKIELFK